MKDKRKINKALRAYQAAAKELSSSLEEEYPAGTVVTVAKGNSVFAAEVIFASRCWWSDPAGMRVKNLNTGKTRNITFEDIAD